MENLYFYEALKEEMQKLGEVSRQEREVSYERARNALCVYLEEAGASITEEQKKLFLESFGSAISKLESEFSAASSSKETEAQQETQEAPLLVPVAVISASRAAREVDSSGARSSDQGIPVSVIRSENKQVVSGNRRPSPSQSPSFSRLPPHLSGKGAMPASPAPSGRRVNSVRVADAGSVLSPEKIRVGSHGRDYAARVMDSRSGTTASPASRVLNPSFPRSARKPAAPVLDSWQGSASGRSSILESRGVSGTQLFDLAKIPVNSPAAEVAAGGRFFRRFGSPLRRSLLMSLFGLMVSAVGGGGYWYADDLSSFLKKGFIVNQGFPGGIEEEIAVGVPQSFSKNILPSSEPDVLKREERLASSANSSVPSVLLVEAAGEQGQRTVQRFDGTSVWKLTETQGQTELVFTASVPEQDVNLEVRMRPSQNVNNPASHILEIVYRAGDSTFGKRIKEIPGIAVLLDDERRMELALRGVGTLVSEGQYVIGLLGDKQTISDGMQRLRASEWLIVPISFEDGSSMMFMVSKEEMGRMALDDVLRAWENEAS